MEQRHLSGSRVRNEAENGQQPAFLVDMDIVVPNTQRWKRIKSRQSIDAMGRPTQAALAMPSCATTASPLLQRTMKR